MIDEGPKDRSFVAFRLHLLTIVKQRDARVLLRSVDPQIELGHDEQGGVAAFNRKRQPTDPKSRLWYDLESILTLGGRFVSPGVFCAPFISCPMPEGFSIGRLFVLGKGVEARVQPVTGSVIGRLSCELIELAKPDDGRELFIDDWWAVRLPDGRVGYVQERFLRNPSATRAIFKKRQGQWYLAGLMASD